jgi:hypothetical protein
MGLLSPAGLRKRLPPPLSFSVSDRVESERSLWQANTKRRYCDMFQVLMYSEEPVDLASFCIDVNIEISRGCGETRNSLDVCGKCIPVKKSKLVHAIRSGKIICRCRETRREEGRCLQVSSASSHSYIPNWNCEASGGTFEVGVVRQGVLRLCYADW